MSDYDPQHAAAALHEARQGRRLVEPLPTAIAPGTVDQGAAVQRREVMRGGALSLAERARSSPGCRPPITRTTAAARLAVTRPLVASSVGEATSV